MTLQLEVPSANEYVAVLESSHVFPLEIWLLYHFICSLFLGLQLCAYLYTKCIFSTFFPTCCFTNFLLKSVQSRISRI